MEWLNENLCTFDEKVRVELGPQIVELDCTDENLCDTKTHANYCIGKRDAYGRHIRPDDMPEGDAKTAVMLEVQRDSNRGVYGVVGQGEKMACVDWRARKAPKLWKIYESQAVEEIDSKGDVVEVQKFVKVDEREGKEDAIAVATELAGGLS